MDKEQEKVKSAFMVLRQREKVSFLGMKTQGFKFHVANE